MRILGIETSCDETGVAVYDETQGLLSHALYSQVDMHAVYGGVVPELASRDHVRRLIPLIHDVLQQANTTPDDLSAIAYTAGPGLMGALLVGATVGQSLAFAWKKPAIAVHHLEGHLLAALLEDEHQPTFPFLALLVSGGHTLLVQVHALTKYAILGESLDDAAGEAFDKTAKILGLGYPGGAALAKLAISGDPSRFRFPRPTLEKSSLNFSFSGLKTHALQTWKKTEQTDKDKADVARAFEDAVIDTLIIKCERALDQTGLTQLVVAGGVGANQQLRLRLQQTLTERGGQVYFPRIDFCTDNGAMIAYAGYLRYKGTGICQPDFKIQVRPRWPIEEINQ